MHERTQKKLMLCLSGECLNKYLKIDLFFQYIYTYKLQPFESYSLFLSVCVGSMQLPWSLRQFSVSVIYKTLNWKLK